MTISVTLLSDPGCPWAYSANPGLAVLQWRYGDGLRWRLVAIGLTEDAQQYVDRGYTPARSVRAHQTFGRRFGMPFASQPRERMVATARGCRAIVATRLTQPDRELAVYRALQFAWFTTPLLLDEDDGILRALEAVDELDAAAVVGALDEPHITAAYEADRAEARTAAGTPTAFQGKAAATDGPVRYTAPSIIFEAGGRRLEAGGFQPVEAYDVVVANLDPTIDRRDAPDDPLEVVEAFPDGLVTAEVAAVMTRGNDVPDREATHAALIEHVAAGRLAREGLADDALWRPASAVARSPRAAAAHAA
jgi:protein-disulfide isomerase-like protein with CxxC motif